MQEITIGENHLYGKLFQADKDTPGVLFIHGWHSSTQASDRYCAALVEQGLTCLSFDMRGHGESPGDIEDYSRKQFIDDALAAYNQLASCGIDQAAITVVGSSFGAYIAALVTAERPVARLVLRVPANYPDYSYEEPHAKGLKRDEVNPVEFSESRAVQAIANFHGRVLVVESELDEVVPDWMVGDYVEAGDEKLVEHFIMPQAPHTISNNQVFAEEYKELLGEWIPSTARVF